MKYKVLVNKDNKIKDSFYKNKEFIEVLNVDNKKVKIDSKTYTAYEELKKYLEKEKIYIGIDDAYRSIEEQKELYKDFSIKYSEEYAKKIVAEPGTSEHHTALAIDLTIKKNNKFIDNNAELFANEETFSKIHKQLHKFGFILRYPKDKEQITGYPYEPWHIRYVGKIPAEIIYTNNLTLEEYLNEFSGVLVINKEKNMTSRDVVNIVSKTLGIKKIGHTGTLDPLAEGVLVLTIGKATKIGELLTASYKEYEAEALLGLKTDTLDITGTTIETKEVPKNIDIESVLNSHKKTYLQEVPSYSAVKVAGKKLYEYARNNEEVTLPKKEVTIKEIKLLNKTDNYFTFSCLVSKGCYIRSLIRDLGISLNTNATMTKLTRTKQGTFSLKDSYTLKDFLQGNFTILSIEQALEYKTVIVEAVMEKKIKNGQIIEDIYNVTDKIIFKNKTGKLLGIYEKGHNNKLKTWKNF